MLPLAAKKLALTTLRTSLDALLGPRILLGDWNVMHLGGAKATDGGREVATNDDLGRHFEGEFLPMLSCTSESTHSLALQGHW